MRASAKLRIQRDTLIHRFGKIDELTGQNARVAPRSHLARVADLLDV